MPLQSCACVERRESVERRLEKVQGNRWWQQQEPTAWYNYLAATRALVTSSIHLTYDYICNNFSDHDGHILVPFLLMLISIKLDLCGSHRRRGGPPHHLHQFSALRT